MPLQPGRIKSTNRKKKRSPATHWLTQIGAETDSPGIAECAHTLRGKRARLVPAWSPGTQVAFLVQGMGMGLITALAIIEDPLLLR